MDSVIAWGTANWALVAWVLCEIIAFSPLKSNSIASLVYNILKSMVGANPPTQLP